MSGKNTLNISLNAAQKVSEVSLINNFLTRNFSVENDRNNPMLDVTFDGYRILNGDFVSPSPVIQITSKDDNPYRLQVDTSTFIVSLKRPGSTTFELISHQSNQIVFYPASEGDNKAKMEYKPEQLPNGMYTLRVQSRDASGNLSGSNSYEIDFKVENKSTITHFFPYPNPGTTNIRFVFTLTGAKPPEELLVRIMTISGKTVREIRHDEFGPIKIGQNISQFAWDGTDQFGDRLANGVYLYQVFTKVNGATIERASTKADKYFMHDTGKIYLLR
jgi:flagellar hook assembly protein FlgD